MKTKNFRISKINKKLFYTLVILSGIILLAVGLAAGFFIGSSQNKELFYPELTIDGDVGTVITVKNKDYLLNEAGLLEHRISEGGNWINAFNLREILELVQPASADSDIYIAGSDGKAAKISYEDSKNSYISFSADKGWQSVNPLHPPSTNIKNVAELLVVSNASGATSDSGSGLGLNIITMDSNLLNATPGNLKLDNRQFYYKVGTSSKELTSSAFVIKDLFTLDDLLNKNTIEADFGQYLIMSREGDYIFTAETGNFEISGNGIDYLPPDGSQVVKNIKGVVLEPSAASIMDAYYDTLAYLKKDMKVLLVITDGLGYNQCREALSGGYMPFVRTEITEGGADIKQALSVYAPVTNTGLAAIFTGQPPSVNGVYSREQRELLVPSIFSDAADLGKDSIYIEGDTSIVKTEVEPILNTDMNDNGTKDDEIYKCTLDNISNNNGLVVVHFHGIDDAGHNYGVSSQQTYNAVKQVDSYIEGLVQKWDGICIITSDHGQHDENGAGNHGQFRFEDLVVPYILIK